MFSQWFTIQNHFSRSYVHFSIFLFWISIHTDTFILFDSLSATYIKQNGISFSFYFWIIFVLFPTAILTIHCGRTSLIGYCIDSYWNESKRKVEKRKETYFGNSIERKNDKTHHLNRTAVWVCARNNAWYTQCVQYV